MAGTAQSNATSASKQPLNYKLVFWISLLLLIACSAVLQIQIASYDVSCTRQAGGCITTQTPILSLEVAREGEAFRKVIDLGDRTCNSHVVRVNTWIDFLAFIPLYWIVFVSLAKYHNISLAKYHNVSWSKWVIRFITIGAGLDFLEDWRIFACLRQLNDHEPVGNFTPGYFGYPKWIVLGLAAIFAGLLIKLAAAKRYSESVAAQEKTPAGDKASLPSKLFPMLIAFGFMGMGVVLMAMPFISGPQDFPSPQYLQIIKILVPVLFVVLPILLALVYYYPFPVEPTLLFIETTYLLRFPIIIGFLLAIALPLFYWLIPSIFTGLFDAVSAPSLALVSWAAFQLAWIVMATTRLILVYGKERFRIDLPELGGVSTRTVVLYGLLALPFVAVTFLGTLNPTIPEKLFAIVGGLVVAIVGLYLIARIHFYLEPSGTNANLVFPSFGRLEHSRDSSRAKVWRHVDNRLRALPPRLQRGLTDGNQLRSGHRLAIVAVSLLLVFYVGLGIIYLPHFVTPEHQPAAILYVLLLLSILCWSLAGVSFFLDVLRLPVLTTLLAASLLTGLIGTDHQFEIPRHLVPSGQQVVATLPPSVVVQAWAKAYQTNHGHPPKTAIIVATAGGGIRAAAWTAEVLTGLRAECDKFADGKSDADDEFGASLVLISSVSGGSVGAMSVLNGFNLDHKLPANALPQIRYNAYRSSLSAVGWGLVYPDFARTFPFLGSLIPETIDRGWALETSWISGWLSPPNMSDWRNEVALGLRPAVIFNATSAENGKRFIAASTDLNGNNAIRFFRDFSGFDIPVSTAARLSASFPYVSPETRATNGPEPYRVHVGDGGYYDNSGILSALEWLQDAQPELKPYRVVFIAIDAGPDKEKTTAPWSWQKQIVGPLDTLLNVRTSSQSDRDDLELKLAQGVANSVLTQDHIFHFLYPVKKINSKDPTRVADKEQRTSCFDRDRAATEKKPFSFALQPDESSPLSWHLNKLQREAIFNACGIKENETARQGVCKVLKGED